MQFIHSNKQYIERSMYLINPYTHSNPGETPLILNDGNTFGWWNFENIVKDSNNKVSQMLDLSGRNYHLNQADINKQPLSQDDSILFDGISDWMYGDEDLEIIFPISLYIVFKNISFKQYSTIFSGFKTPAGGGYQYNFMDLMQYQNESTYWQFTYGAGDQIVNNPIPYGDYSIVRYIVTTWPSSVSLKNNDFEQIVIGGGIVQGPIGFTLGTSTYDEGRCANFAVKEIILRKHDNIVNETSIYNYLKSKYNL